MGLPDDRTLFMARIALSAEPPATETVLDAPKFEMEIRHIIAEEGGRVVDVFWHRAFLSLGEEAEILRPIVMFETRAQCPVSRPEGISLELYARPPDLDEEGDPIPLDSYQMAESIWRAINRSGSFLVIEMEEWRRSASFHPPAEHLSRDAVRESVAEIAIFVPEEDEP